MFISDVIKTRNMHAERNDVNYHKYSHGAASYALNGKNVKAMFKYIIPSPFRVFRCETVNFCRVKHGIKLFGNNFICLKNENFSTV